VHEPSLACRVTNPTKQTTQDYMEVVCVGLGTKVCRIPRQVLARPSLRLIGAGSDRSDGSRCRGISRRTSPPSYPWRGGLKPTNFGAAVALHATTSKIREATPQIASLTMADMVPMAGREARFQLCFRTGPMLCGMWEPARKDLRMPFLGRLGQGILAHMSAGSGRGTKA
jgi:hypothetical protein